MIRAIVVLVLAMLLGVTMSCTTLADEYVGGTSQFAIFVAWTADGSGHLQGQVQMAGLAGPKINRTSGSFTGTRSGSEVSLVFPLLGYFSGQTWIGNFGFRSLTLHLPDSDEIPLSAGSFADYRNRVSALEQTASVAASAAAVANAHALRVADAQNALNAVNAQWNTEKSRLTDALGELRGRFPMPPPDPSDPRTLRAKYALAVSRIDAAWAHEQDLGNVSNLSCYQKSQVAYAASQVSYARSELQYQDSEFETFDRTTIADLASAHSAIEAMEQLYPTFKIRYREFQQLVPSTPDAQLTQGSIDTMKRDLLPLFDQVLLRLSAARVLARDDDRYAEALESKAKAFAASLACIDRPS